jgi:hypothetical protein
MFFRSLALPSTTVVCMSPRRNWDSPTPSAASECAPPPGTKGGGAPSPAGEGVVESQFRRLEKILALCLLCALRPCLCLNFRPLYVRGFCFIKFEH